MRRLPKLPLAVVAAAAVVAGAAACGSQSVSPSAKPHDGAVLFALRCSGCHTLSAAGAEGSGNNVRTKLRNQGPSLDQRKETRSAVLFAIRNGGFSGAIMPQNIVVGAQAEAVAQFVARYAGRNAKQPPGPAQGATTSP